MRAQFSPLTHNGQWYRWGWVCLLLGLTGCSAFRPLKGISPRQVPYAIRGESRSNKETIDLRRLSMSPPAEYRVDRGDVLAIYIEGILGNAEDPAPVFLPNDGENGRPAYGYPIPVRDDGTISLPLVRSLAVRGMTIRQVEEALIWAYKQNKEFLAKDSDRIMVSLQKPRTHKIMVIRQEQQNPQEISFAGSGSINLGAVKRGMGQVVTLAAYENDVLHALAKTGGLPGLDAQNAIYVLRRPHPMAMMSGGLVAPPSAFQRPGFSAPVAPTAPGQVPVEAARAVRPASWELPSPDPFAANHTTGLAGVIEADDDIEFSAAAAQQAQVTPANLKRGAADQKRLRWTRQQNDDAQTEEAEDDNSTVPYPPAEYLPQPGYLPNPGGNPGVLLPNAMPNLAPPGGWTPPQAPTLPPGAALPSFVPGAAPLDQQQIPPELMPYYTSGAEVVRVPIRLFPGEIPMFNEQDIILQDGDILFIESRETEVFYTGGLLGGGQYVLPRDYDLDVLAAISIATGRQSTNSSGAGIGNRIGGIASTNQDISVSASDVVILRQLADGNQVPIKVNLNKALRDPQERIVIQPGDYVILQYKPIEAVGAFIERNLLAGSIIGLAATMQNGR